VRENVGFLKILVKVYLLGGTGMLKIQFYKCNFDNFTKSLMSFILIYAFDFKSYILFWFQIYIQKSKNRDAYCF
jgi:hypothetical protein